MKSSFPSYWRDLACGTRTTTVGRLLILLLAPFSLVYSFIQRLRAAMYRTGMLKTGRLPRPVVSIGNITVGGTGKTPVTAYIARLLLEQGYKVAVLSRGYGGSLEGQIAIVSDGATLLLGPRECGDEPYLLASTVPGLMVVIGTDRYAAGQMAMQQLSPDVFLLDDGFQHLRLWRDLNILLLDSARPFGNGWTLPAGLLRESAQAAARADLVILTRCPKGTTLAPRSTGIPCCTSHHQLIDLLPLSGGPHVQFSSLANNNVLAFAGIADPISFFDELRCRGLNLVHTIRLPDHTSYTESDLSAIKEAMEKYGADMAVTTEKDGVKLQDLPLEFRQRIMLARLELIIMEPAPLKEHLCNLLQK